MKPIYEIKAPRIDGTPASLADYEGKVMLIVNVASKCGLTPQYDGLEKLYATYKDKGLVVLGFPANNFDGQEPGTDEQIADFCRSVYGVDFPMFSKLSVRGDDQAPLYKVLTDAQPKRTLNATPKPGAVAKQTQKDVRWNFEKFLVSRNGDVVGRFDPDLVPLDPILVGAVERALKA
ncbi:MAG TPA: glutathione peroxidase [Bauldia sp.]|nr:glutathione peroxidase [Bauldia sp.]